MRVPGVGRRIGRLHRSLRGSRFSWRIWGRGGQPLPRGWPRHAGHRGTGSRWMKGMPVSQRSAGRARAPLAWPELNSALDARAVHSSLWWLSFLVRFEGGRLAIGRATDRIARRSSPALADHLRTELAADALANAVAARDPAAGVIFHSDIGSTPLPPSLILPRTARSPCPWAVRANAGTTPWPRAFSPR
jgi:hypothetical protein